MATFQATISTRCASSQEANKIFAAWYAILAGRVTCDAVLQAAGGTGGNFLAFLFDAAKFAATVRGRLARLLPAGTGASFANVEDNRRRIIARGSEDRCNSMASVQGA